MRHGVTLVIALAVSLALFASSPSADTRGSTQDRAGSELRIARPRLSQAFAAVHAVGGKAFGVVERGDGAVGVTWIPTSVPAAEAYGLSPEGEEIVYMPLVEGVVTGELWRERLDTGARARLTSHTIVTAAVGPSQPFTVAFTHAAQDGFSVSVVNVATGVETDVPSKSVMPDSIRVDARGVLFYFEEDVPFLVTDDDMVEPTLRAVAFDPETGELRNVFESAEGYPYITAPTYDVLGHAAAPTATSFSVQSGTIEVSGDTLLGEARLQVRDRSADIVRDLGNGVLLDVLSKGAVIRRILDGSTSIEYVSWSGLTHVIGVNDTITFTLPLAKAVLTQNGEAYSGPCGISGHTKAKKQEYAYDLQGPSGSHVLAVAPGTVVSRVENVTCNNYDEDCPIYVEGCPANSGWGNTVIYKLSDSTYIKTAHHRPFTFQSGAETLCAGRYYADQGATGRSNGNLDGCGAHVHIQRQAGADLSGRSSSLYFTELGGTAGKCGTTYKSLASEVTSCAATPGSKTLKSLSITGPSSLNEDSSTDYDAIAKWSDNSTTTVKPDWSENSSYTTISSSGLLKAMSVSSNKTVTVKATYSFGGVTKTATKEVTIVNAKTLKSLSITGPSSLNENSSADYDAIAKWSDNSTTTVKPEWSENSSYTTISSSGLLKAKPVSSDKTVTVKATYSFGGVTKTATKDVKIRNR